MNTTRRSYLVLALCGTVSLISLSMSGCSSAEPKFIGKWKMKQPETWWRYQPTQFEFFKGGKLRVSMNHDSIAGTWAEVEDNRVRIEVLYFDNHFMWTAAVSNGTLTLDMGIDKATIYERPQ